MIKIMQNILNQQLFDFQVRKFAINFIQLLSKRLKADEMQERKNFY